MTETTKKSFSKIRDDYAFFENHTTEFDQDLYHYQQTLAKFTPPAKPLKFLDFGCGTGVFTSRFIKLFHLFHPPVEELEITLIEPDESYRHNAVHLLSQYAHSPIQSFPYLPPDISDQFHLILSNHVLYYVPDLRATITWLLQRRHPQGMMLVTMAGKDNIISQFWRSCFDFLGQAIPYHLAEDLIPIIHNLYPSYQRRTVTYTLRFPDTLDNRWKLLRFMLGEHLAQLQAYDLPSLFDPYASQGQVDITTSHYQFIFAPADGYRS
jgi:trans-aconitate 2-methyltransferase